MLFCGHNLPNRLFSVGRHLRHYTHEYYHNLAREAGGILRKTTYSTDLDKCCFDIRFNIGKILQYFFAWPTSARLNYASVTMLGFYAVPEAPVSIITFEALQFDFDFSIFSMGLWGPITTLRASLNLLLLPTSVGLWNTVFSLFLDIAVHSGQSVIRFNPK